MNLRRWLGPGLGIVILIVFLISPPIEPLTPLGMKASGVLLFTIVWWITVGVGYPSLLGLALLALTGVMTPKAVFAASWGNYITIFIIAIFGLVQALRNSGFARRFALWFMTRPFTVGHPWRLVAMCLLSCLLLGSFMSGAAVCVIFLAIAEPMLEAAGYSKGDKFAAALMMGICWAANATATMNAFTHGGNILLMEWIQRDFGYTITIPVWMIAGFPMGFLLYLLILVILRYVVHPDASKFGGAASDYVHRERGKLGSVKLEEGLALGVFLIVILCWFLPGIAGGISPQLVSYLKGIGLAIPPLVGACVLCIIRVKNRPLLTFQQWTGSVPWSSVALITLILVMRNVIADPETGISQLFTNILQPIATSVPFLVFLLISLFWVCIQTQFMSNMCSMALVYTVMVPIAAATGTGNPIALGFVINTLARQANSLPSGTVNTAIVIGTGWVPVSFMARYGAIMIIPMVLLWTFVCYPWASFIFR